MLGNQGLILDREILSGSGDRSIGSFSSGNPEVHFPIIEGLLEGGKVAELLGAAEMLRRNLRSCIDWHGDFELSMQAETAVQGLTATMSLMEDLKRIAEKCRNDRASKRIS